MQFGVHLPNSGALSPYADLVAMARRAEEVGFDTVWVFDHLFNPVELGTESSAHRGGVPYHNRPEMPYYDALTTLSVVAGATSRIRLGTRVLIPVYRDPMLVAKQVGTLAALAGPDRVILGVGAGWLFEEFDALGIPFAERFARLDEHVAVLRQAWSAGTAGFEGRYYRHPPAGFLPAPPGRLPIVVGGGGDGALRRAARWGDGWAMPGPVPGPAAVDELRRGLDRLRRACDEEGRDFDELLLVAPAPVSAGDEFFDLLAGAGVDMVDVMLEEPDDLDLGRAEALLERIRPRYGVT